MNEITRVVETAADLSAPGTGASFNADMVAEWNSKHQTWLDEHRNTLRDIGRQTVTNQNLSNMNLNWVKSSYSNFSGNNFEGAQLDHANLTSVDFSGSTMSNIHMHHARAYLANFSGIEADSPDFAHSELTNAVFVGAKLKNPHIKHARLGFANFTGAEIEGLDLSERGRDSFTSINFENATLRNANFSNSALYCDNFNGAQLDGANFTNTKVPTSSFIGASLRGAKFIKNASGIIGNAKFLNADLCGADFTGYAVKDFEKAFFEGAKYDDQTKFPESIDCEALGMVKLEKRPDRNVLVVEKAGPLALTNANISLEELLRNNQGQPLTADLVNQIVLAAAATGQAHSSNKQF